MLQSHSVDAPTYFAAFPEKHHAGASASSWLTERQVAALINCSLSKLRQDRHKCRGIPYVKFGRSVRYSLADIQAHMDSNLITPIQ